MNTDENTLLADAGIHHFKLCDVARRSILIFYLNDHKRGSFLFSQITPLKIREVEFKSMECSFICIEILNSATKISSQTRISQFLIIQRRNRFWPAYQGCKERAKFLLFQSKLSLQWDFYRKSIR